MMTLISFYLVFSELVRYIEKLFKNYFKNLLISLRIFIFGVSLYIQHFVVVVKNWLFNICPFSVSKIVCFHLF